MIRLESVSKQYSNPAAKSVSPSQSVTALRNINLEIKPGEFVSIMGPSGCGKSTLLHLIGGLDSPSEGKIWVNELAVHQMSEHDLSLFRRKNIGVVFQFFNLLPQLSILENTGLPLRLLGIPPSEAEEKSSALLKQIGLGEKTHRLPAELSGGEQQRAAIARALIHQPKLLLADEPTGNLDSQTTGRVLELLGQLQKEFKITLLLVTHSLEVSSLAQRTILMQDGSIV